MADTQIWLTVDMERPDPVKIGVAATFLFNEYLKRNGRECVFTYKVNEDGSGLLEIRGFADGE